jgi:hypothetical protein
MRIILIMLLCSAAFAGTGLTDWDNCSMYGKLMLFIFAAWAGAAVSSAAVSQPLILLRICAWLRMHCYSKV